MDGALQVHANELTCDQSVTAGEIARKVESPVGKFKVFKNLLSSWTGDKKSLTVYIGDSVDDLLCLLQADIGIVIECSSSLRRVGNQFGVSFMPLFQGLVEKQKGAKGSSLNWNKLSGILYTVTSWAEIHAFILGRMEEDPPTSIEQSLPTKKRASDSEVIDSSSLKSLSQAQPLPRPNKLKIKITTPRMEADPPTPIEQSLRTQKRASDLEVSSLKSLSTAQSLPPSKKLKIKIGNPSLSTPVHQLSATNCARDLEKSLLSENRSVQLKTIRKDEKKKGILRLIPAPWWRQRLEKNSIVKFRNGIMEGGRTYEVKCAMDKNLKETNLDIPLFRGKELKAWYQGEELEIGDECVLEFLDSHTVNYYIFPRKNYPGFSPVPPSSSVPTSSSLPLPSTSVVPPASEFTSEVKDLVSFKSFFLKDRERGQPTFGFPEDLIEDYYRLCLLEKRLIHGKVYETHGAELGDGLIKKMVWVFKKARSILSMEVGGVTHEEIDALLLGVVVIEKNGCDLGVLGKSLRDIKSIKDNIDQLMMKYKNITATVVELIDEVLRKE